MCCPWYDHIMKLVLSIAHNIMNIIKPTMKIITHIVKLKAAAAASTLLLHSKFRLIRNLDLVIYLFLSERATLYFVFCLNNFSRKVKTKDYIPATVLHFVNTWRLLVAYKHTYGPLFCGFY